MIIFKKKYNFLFDNFILSTFLILYFDISIAQTTLSPGDIMLVTLNADGNDNFDFVPLVSLEANTVIFFTDNAWDGSAIKSNEGTLKYTSSSSVSLGTIVSFTGTVGGEWSTEDAGFNISGTGDNIIVFQGSSASPTFIHGVGWAKSTTWITTGTVDANDSYIPIGLSVSNNTIVSLSTADNYQYDTSNGTSGPKSTLRYLTSQAGNFNSNSSTTYSALSASFDVGCIISGNAGFRMMSSPVSGAILSDLLSELWTQGMTGADADYTGNNNANVWTLDVANQIWTALSDISTSGTSLTAGEGFMVYVFSDTDNDGTDDLPVTLSVSGTENSSSATLPSSGTIGYNSGTSTGHWALAGNPYASTIDWDLITQTNVVTSCYVWDDATNAYISWNGSAGSLTDGLIAPYQGFWVQASNNSGGSITIETSDKSSQAGTFYRTMNDSTGSASLTVSSNGYDRTIYVSFNLNGDVSLDIADAYQLMPMQMTNHLIAMTYADETALAINNLPVSYTEEVTVPLDVMMLTVENQLFQPMEADGLITWDISNVPNNLTLSITNQLTGTRTPLTEGDALSFTTELKDAFGYPEGTVNHYPLNGESLFALTVSQTQMASENETVPRHFALHPVYPNPFNPSTMISFDVPLVETLDITSLQVYNIKGQLVETLVNEQLNPGTHKIQWNPVNLSSGTYVVKLKSGEKTFTQKITYIK